MARQPGVARARVLRNSFNRTERGVRHYCSSHPGPCHRDLLNSSHHSCFRYFLLRCFHRWRVALQAPVALGTRAGPLDRLRCPGVAISKGKLRFFFERAIEIYLHLALLGLPLHLQSQQRDRSLSRKRDPAEPRDR